MKHYILLIIASVLTLMSTSCKASPDIPASQTPTKQPDQETVVESIAETNPHEPSIKDTATPFNSSDSVFYIENAYIEEGLMQTLLPFGDHFLIYGSRTINDQPGITLAVLNKSDGTILYETQLDFMDYCDVATQGSQVTFCDWSSGNIYILDETLTITDTFTSDYPSFATFLSPDATKIYSITIHEGIIITDRITGNKETRLPNATEMFVNTHIGNFVCVSFIDKETQMHVRAALNLETGECTAIPFDGTFGTTQYNDELWLMQNIEDNQTYYIGKGDRLNTFSLTDKLSFAEMLPKENRLLTKTFTREGSMAMVLYNMDGSFISHCDLGIIGGGFTYPPIWSEEDNGYYFTITDSTGHDLLLFWDISTPQTGMDLQFKSANAHEIVICTAVDSKLYERAQSLEDTYGIRIKIAEQTEIDYLDFHACQETDPTYIQSALDTLELVLQAYPEGFFKQLVYGTTDEIQFHLVGELTKTTLTEEDTSGFTSFGGFTQDREGRAIVAVNIAGLSSLEQLLHHEIAHLIDNRLTFDAKIREDSLYSDAAWEALNPKGFAYANSYTNLPMEFYNDGYEAYFAELYSRTFIREDRATIMEYAMMGYSHTFTEAPGRLAKLEYWNSCIRDAFDTTGWPEVTVWEKILY